MGLSNFDLYAEPAAYALKFQGNWKVPTCMGRLYSWLLLAMSLVFISVTIWGDFIDYEPNFNETVHENFYTSSKKIDLFKNNFLFAVGVRSYLGKDFKNDPRYTRWVIEYETYDGPTKFVE